MSIFQAFEPAVRDEVEPDLCYEMSLMLPAAGEGSNTRLRPDAEHVLHCVDVEDFYAKLKLHKPWLIGRHRLSALRYARGNWDGINPFPSDIIGPSYSCSHFEPDATIAEKTTIMLKHFVLVQGKCMPAELAYTLRVPLPDSGTDAEFLDRFLSGFIAEAENRQVAEREDAEIFQGADYEELLRDEPEPESSNESEPESSTESEPEPSNEPEPESSNGPSASGPSTLPLAASNTRANGLVAPRVHFAVDNADEIPSVDKGKGRALDSYSNGPVSGPTLAHPRPHRRLDSVLFSHERAWAPLMPTGAASASNPWPDPWRKRDVAPSLPTGAASASNPWQLNFNSSTPRRPVTWRQESRFASFFEQEYHPPQPTAERTNHGDSGPLVVLAHSPKLSEDEEAAEYFASQGAQAASSSNATLERNSNSNPFEHDRVVQRAYGHGSNGLMGPSRADVFNGANEAHNDEYYRALRDARFYQARFPTSMPQPQPQPQPGPASAQYTNLAFDPMAANFVPFRSNAAVEQHDNIVLSRDLATLAHLENETKKNTSILGQAGFMAQGPSSAYANLDAASALQMQREQMIYSARQRRR